jgi:hypothetical protein
VIQYVNDKIIKDKTYDQLHKEWYEQMNKLRELRNEETFYLKEFHDQS